MEVFCLFYYVSCYVSAIPQIWKLLKTKKSGDYSLGKTMIAYLGNLCWAVYIFTSVQSVLVYIGTVADVIISTLTTVLVFRYYKNPHVVEAGSQQVI